MDLCCLLYRALTLEPVPVIGGILYAVGAEGVNLRELSLEMNSRCVVHKYNLETAIDTLLKKGENGKRCLCENVKEKTSCRELNNLQSKVRKRKGGALTEDSAAKRSQAFNTSTLWAYELDPVVNAYKWLWQNRSSLYSKCCDAAVVCQMKRSKSLPPGLYVYRTLPSHFHCTAERPLAVIDQFDCSALGTHTTSPGVITIDVFPGKASFSAIYVVERIHHDCKTAKYSNRMYGEALALGLTDPSVGAELCTNHNVAVRNNRMCVIDLRWNSFNTRTECVNAIPRVKGLRGLFWSNHISDTLKIEREVLFWLFGYTNELPREVHTADNQNEKHNVKYLLLDLTSFHEDLPQPPSKTTSWFRHIYFEGDFDIATYAIGIVPEGMRRISTPVKDHEENYWHQMKLSPGDRPTPYSVGTAYKSTVYEQDTELLLEIQKYVFKETGGCMAVAVNYTLYYDSVIREYQVMVCHTVLDKKDDLRVFRL